MTPVLARTRRELALARAALSEPVVLVPTMGALHDGHRTLLRRARELAGPAGSVLVTVFVNPLQFGAGEDLDAYPRPLGADLAACASEGAAAVFAPTDAEMYPSPPMVTVDPGPVGGVLEGAFRPGHFAGVLTVVLKLFELTRPHVAVFGEKDAQQLALIRRMTSDLDLGVRIVSVPIVRDPDGLAISSRNVYLTPHQRAAALALPRALHAARDNVAAGADAALAAAQAVLNQAEDGDPPVKMDYLVLADPVTFSAVQPGHSGAARLLAAVRVGSTRLIDNVSLDFGDAGD